MNKKLIEAIFDDIEIQVKISISESDKIVEDEQRERIGSRPLTTEERIIKLSQVHA